MNPSDRVLLTGLFPIVLSLARRRRRSFRADAQAAVSRLRPPLQVLGREHIPAAGPCLLTVNHYHSPTFQAWWLSLSISASVPADVHWIITSTLTFKDWRANVITPLSQWTLPRVARMYGFTPMPPMPPRPFEAAARAESVRDVLRFIRDTGRPVVGLAPEGGDAPGGVLAALPPGSGRLIQHLSTLGLTIIPIGAYESDGAFCIHFGAPYSLQVDTALPPDERDAAAGNCVMRHIAELLPPRLRGPFV